MKRSSRAVEAAQATGSYVWEESVERVCRSAGKGGEGGKLMLGTYRIKRYRREPSCGGGPGDGALHV